MRYIAEKKDEDFLITGIKEMETVDGNKVEVKIDNKIYKEKLLKACIEDLNIQYEAMIEKHDNDIKDLNAILEAINNCK